MTQRSLDCSRVNLAAAAAAATAAAAVGAAVPGSNVEKNIFLDGLPRVIGVVATSTSLH